MAILILPNLKVLNISCNFLNHIPPKFFHHPFNLKIMSILQNPLLFFKSLSFEITKIDILESDDYRMCCTVSSVKFCTATKPWYFNCKSLLPTFTMRICIAIVACLILMFSTISIVLQSKIRTKYSIFPVAVMCLNVSDMLVSVYFVILLIAEVIYNENIISYEKVWKRSFPCYLIFFTSLLFTIESPILLSLISFSRLRAVLKPLECKFKIHSIFIQLTLCVFIGLLMAAALTTGQAVMHKELPTPLCLPFVDPSNSQWVIKLITIMTVVIQVSSSVIIVTVYLSFIKLLNKGLKYYQHNIFRQRTKVSVMIQLVIVTASNIACWIPANIIYLISLYMSKYSKELMVWTTIAVTPINSVINPFLFIVTTIRKNKKQAKSGLLLKMKIFCDKEEITSY